MTLTAQSTSSLDLGQAMDKPKERRKVMKYTKPEIEVLGTALDVIQMAPPPAKISGLTDGANDPDRVVNPAYDLDE